MKEAKLRQLLVLKLALYKQVRDVVSVFTGSLRQTQATCKEAQILSPELVFFWLGLRHSKDGAGEKLTLSLIMHIISSDKLRTVSSDSSFHHITVEKDGYKAGYDAFYCWVCTGN